MPAPVFSIKGNKKVYAEYTLSEVTKTDGILTKGRKETTDRGAHNEGDERQ